MLDELKPCRYCGHVHPHTYRVSTYCTDALTAQVVALNEKVAEYAAALQDIDSNFQSGVLIGKALSAQTHATIDKAQRE